MRLMSAHMDLLYDSRAPKKAANLSINSDLLRRARQFDVNLSAVLETALEEILKARVREQWLEENRDAIRAHNEYVEAHGVFGNALRSF